MNKTAKVGQRTYEVPADSHVADVEYFTNNHGYPYRATCLCGWKSRGMVTRAAAMMLGNDHMN